jgi:hypothetical protein
LLGATTFSTTAFRRTTLVRIELYRLRLIIFSPAKLRMLLIVVWLIRNSDTFQYFYNTDTKKYLPIPNKTSQTWDKVVSFGTDNISSTVTNTIPVLPWYSHDMYCLLYVCLVPILVIYRKPLTQIQNCAHHNDLAGQHNLMQYNCVIYCSYSHTNLYYTILHCVFLLCAVRPNAVVPLACLVSVLFRGLTERYKRFSFTSIYQGEGYSAQICNNFKKRENENSFLTT